MNWFETLFGFLDGLIQVGYNTIGREGTSLLLIVATILAGPIILVAGIATARLCGKIIITIPFFLYFGTWKNVAVVRYRLDRIWGKSAVLYSERDHFRSSGQSLVSINEDIKRANRRFDRAMGWALINGFGPIVATFLRMKM